MWAIDNLSFLHSLLNLSLVLSLPSWLPGMSFKRKMAIAKGLSKQYIERPFSHSLQKPVGRHGLSHICISDCVKLSAQSVSSMVHDALRNAEDKGILPDESWTENLKEAAATAFLGRLFRYSDRSFTHCILKRISCFRDGA
jgi:hypothetical protein